MDKLPPAAIWKYLLYTLTAMETEDAKYQPHEVWQAAWVAFERRALAKQENVRTDILRAESRGEEPPDVTTKGKCLAPLASLGEARASMGRNDHSQN